MISVCHLSPERGVEEFPPEGSDTRKFVGFRSPRRGGWGDTGAPLCGWLSCQPTPRGFLMLWPIPGGVPPSTIFRGWIPLCCPQDDRSGTGGAASFRGRTTKPRTLVPGSSAQTSSGQCGTSRGTVGVWTTRYTTPATHARTPTMPSGSSRTRWVRMPYGSLNH